jgi:hypothetical protein
MTESTGGYEPETGSHEEDSEDSPVRKPEEPTGEAHGGEGAEQSGPEGEDQAHQTRRDEHEE